MGLTKNELDRKTIQKVFTLIQKTYSYLAMIINEQNKQKSVSSNENLHLNI